jgi:hypothetical protein
LITKKFEELLEMFFDEQATILQSNRRIYYLDHICCSGILHGGETSHNRYDTRKHFFWLITTKKKTFSSCYKILLKLQISYNGYQPLFYKDPIDLFREFNYKLLFLIRILRPIFSCENYPMIVSHGVYVNSRNCMPEK